MATDRVEVGGWTFAVQDRAVLATGPGDWGTGQMQPRDAAHILIDALLAARVDGRLLQQAIRRLLTPDQAAMLLPMEEAAFGRIEEAP